jgi:phosphate starvation-inducible protein PhoH and related proteins
LTSASIERHNTSTKTVVLDNASPRVLADLCGSLNSYLHQIEKRFQVRIYNRGNQFSLSGDIRSVETVAQLLAALCHEVMEGEILTPSQVHLWVQQYYTQKQKRAKSVSTLALPTSDNIEKLTIIKTKKGAVKPRSENQQSYVNAIFTHDINFGVGPAGTGKTFLAVACAVDALLKDEIERILLVRPAVEAGEKLGFLPGDLAQKIDPYLRPLYDALYEMLGFETVDKLIERNVIELAPLAYMRGRTLNNAFVILDEGQNTTREQMKMFLTRIGFGSTAVINGDPTQVDLPKGQDSGLKHALRVLDGIKGISLTYFGSKDIVRHPIVQRIVDAYESFDLEVDAL